MPTHSSNAARTTNSYQLHMQSPGQILSIVLHLQCSATVLTRDEALNLDHYLHDCAPYMPSVFCFICRPDNIQGSPRPVMAT